MKKLIVFDLDDTLTMTKSAVTDRMAELLSRLIEKIDVCIITGGIFDQIDKQAISKLGLNHSQLSRLHIMPTSGTRYHRWDDIDKKWRLIYKNDINDTDKAKALKTLEVEAKKLGIWIDNPAGEIIEDRLSQITYSALGQQSKPEDKYRWDPDKKIRSKLASTINPLLPDGLEARVGGTTSVDITLPGVDKGYGMKNLIEEMQISKEEVLFVGDSLQEGGNDYPVKAMGIDCIEVKDHNQTEPVIETLLALL